MSSERLDAFDRFNSLIHFETVDSEKLAVEHYDLFSAGSDQIWAMRKFARNERWAYLQFALPSQRIALSPSLGVSESSIIRRKRLASYLKNFDSVSVREENGADLIFAATGKRVPVLCDPTLVVPKDQWCSLSDDRLVPRGPYVFSYLLGEDNAEANETLKYVTDGGKIPVLSLSDRERNGELPAGPAEFLALIDNASHVITDSFHAAVLV